MISVQHLKNLSDKVLIENTDRLAQNEREILTEVLRHLQEIDRRKLFSALGYPSLFEYTKHRLKYSEDQAYRRITAMKLLRELPEVESRIASGKISLTNLSAAQTLFRKEEAHGRGKYAKAEKMAILSKLENKTTRDGQKALIEASSAPQLLSIDTIRPTANNALVFNFTGDTELEEKLECLRGLLAHKYPHLTMNQLVHLLCDLALKQWHPLRCVPRRPRNIALATPQ